MQSQDSPSALWNNGWRVGREGGFCRRNRKKRNNIVLLAKRRKVTLVCRSKWARCSTVYLLNYLRDKAGSVLEKFRPKSRYSPPPAQTLRKSILCLMVRTCILESDILGYFFFYLSGVWSWAHQFTSLSLSLPFITGQGLKHGFCGRLNSTIPKFCIRGFGKVS